MLYQRPELEIVLETNDVIRTSDPYHDFDDGTNDKNDTSTQWPT